MDKYAQALTQAMDETGTSNTRVAEVARVGRNNVAHWRVGRRPIPADHAPAIAALLGVAPERISRAYDQMLRVESAQQVMALQGLRPGSTPDAHVSLERLEGFARADMPVRIWLPEFVVRRELGPTPVQHVRWAVQMSRAMEPDIRRNALVLVDTSMCRHEDVVDVGRHAHGIGQVAMPGHAHPHGRHGRSLPKTRRTFDTSAGCAGRSIESPQLGWA